MSNGTISNPMAELLEALERARVEGQLEALALGDVQGVLVAGAGPVWLCEELAAHAPFVAADAPPANDVVPNRLDLVARTRVVRLHLDGVELLLCGRGHGADFGLGAAARSARRLLAARVQSPDRYAAWPDPYAAWEDAPTRTVGLDTAPRS